MGYITNKDGNRVPFPHRHYHSPEKNHHPASDHPKNWDKYLKDRAYTHAHPHTHDSENAHTFTSVSDHENNGSFGVNSDVDVGDSGVLGLDRHDVYDLAIS